MSEDDSLNIKLMIYSLVMLSHSAGYHTLMQSMSLFALDLKEHIFFCISKNKFLFENLPKNSRNYFKLIYYKLKKRF